MTILKVLWFLICVATMIGLAVSGQCWWAAGFGFSAGFWYGEISTLFIDWLAAR